MIMSSRFVNTQRAYYQALYVDGHQTNDLYLAYCGMENCPSDHFYGPLSRSEYLIHFIIDGRGYFHINGKKYSLHKNQAFLIPPGIDTYYCADPDDPYSYAWVAFNGEKVPSYLSQTMLSLECPVCDLNIGTERFLESIQKLLACKELTLANEIKRTGTLFHILAQLIASGHAASNGSIPLNYPAEAYAEYAAQYIEINYPHITVTDIVNHIGINRSYLYTVFKNRFQISPQEYLITYRMEKAAALLRETKQPISQVAQEVGYKDSFTFSKIFKKQYGTSPKFYRSRH